MGINLMSACHRHKVKVLHYRGEEDKTMMPFYYKHRECYERYAKDNVETKDDQAQEEDWMETYAYDEKVMRLIRPKDLKGEVEK